MGRGGMDPAVAKKRKKPRHPPDYAVDHSPRFSPLDDRSDVSRRVCAEWTARTPRRTRRSTAGRSAPTPCSRSVNHPAQRPQDLAVPRPFPFADLFHRKPIRSLVAGLTQGMFFEEGQRMGEITLDKVRSMADHLSPCDQARLLAHLSGRIAHVVASLSSTAPPPSASTAEAWKEFFGLGEALAASDIAQGETLTATLLAMRR